MYGREPPSSSLILVNGAPVKPSSVGLNVFFWYASSSARIFSAVATSIAPLRPASAATSPLSLDAPDFKAAINPPSGSGPSFCRPKASGYFAYAACMAVA